MTVRNKNKIIVLGLGAALALLLFWKKKPPLPEPPENGVIVAIMNPPSGANKWQMRIIDDVSLKMLSWGGDAHNNIEEAASFTLSPEWLFPLMVDISIYEAWQENEEWHSRQLYRVQSHHPTLWDFDKMDWGNEEDPTYKEVLIPEYGSYYYNVAKGRFE